MCNPTSGAPFRDSDLQNETMITVCVDVKSAGFVTCKAHQQEEY